MSTHSNPAQHFGLSCCLHCTHTPCRSLCPEGGGRGSVLIVSAGKGLPRGCPFLLSSELHLRSLLGSCGDFTLDLCREDALRGEWDTSNYGAVQYMESPNRRAETVEYIVGKWRVGKCAALGLRPGWRSSPALRGFFQRSAPMLWQLERIRAANEPEQEAAIAPEAFPVETGPIRITDLRWEHVDETRRKDSPTVAREGDTLRLMADIDNYIEGAGVEFFLWDAGGSSKKQLTKIHTRCRDNGAEVEWSVALAKAGEEPKVEFEVEARSKLSERCGIDVTTATLGGACIHIRDGDSLLKKGVSITLRANGQSIYEDALSDGILEIHDIDNATLEVECELGEHTVTRRVRWLPGKAPFVIQTITVREIETKGQQ